MSITMRFGSPLLLLHRCRHLNNNAHENAFIKHTQMEHYVDLVLPQHLHAHFCMFFISQWKITQFVPHCILQPPWQQLQPWCAKYVLLSLVAGMLQISPHRLHVYVHDRRRPVANRSAYANECSISGTGLRLSVISRKSSLFCFGLIANRKS